MKPIFLSCTIFLALFPSAFAMNSEVFSFTVSVTGGRFAASCESTGENFEVIREYLINLTNIATQKNFSGNIGSLKVVVKKHFRTKDVEDLYDYILQCWN